MKTKSGLQCFYQTSQQGSVRVNRTLDFMGFYFGKTSRIGGKTVKADKQEKAILFRFGFNYKVMKI